MTRFLYQMHIMWYELDMVSETLDSFIYAKKYSPVPIDVSVCFNKQTYLEHPIIDNINERFDALSKHPALQDATIIEKTMNDSFYNVGDWRREVKTKDGYTVWGESDTLVPNVYFMLLNNIWEMRGQMTAPHVVSLASRKMWDTSWTPVEHPSVKGYTYYTNGKSDAPIPFGHDHYITQEQLDEFNSNFLDELSLEVISPPKLDGSMLALHPELPQLIADDVPMIGEDFCAQLALTVLNIPQYHISNILKGHNYHHPNKRTNTLANRNELGEVLRGGELFDKLKMQSVSARERFIKGLLNV